LYSLKLGGIILLEKLKGTAEDRGVADMENQYMSNQNMTEDVGESKEKGFFEKAKEYKKEIAIGAGAVLFVVLVVKNRKAFISAIKSLHIEEVLTNSLETRNNACPLIPESVSKSVTSDLPIGNIMNVREHIRNLPEGWNPSISKVELAAKYGYSLEEHQTWVNAYTKASA
jgi:hypothetical protein